ncbi:uncharacterized protein LOC127868930 [Dreissena polymorpha]|uniref:uncharacterized protein LOC127868930 n=1 Tax=Dreissena polymorpha TaxID=45954 RepID=UPI0022648038|nr:uncharacterized protein LOC127868930 [Dreissena polymorpha]
MLKIGKQLFYLADEGQSHGKGANAVVSQVHHYLNTYGLGEQHAHFQRDNFCGQNKNNIVIWYLLWRVLVGLHRIITLSFMLIRHTKFTPDWHFGILKLKWRNFNAEMLSDVAASVGLSSSTSHNIRQLDVVRREFLYNWYMGGNSVHDFYNLMSKKDNDTLLKLCLYVYHLLNKIG